MSVSPYTSWLTKVSESDVLIAPLGSGGVVTVDTGGYVRLWETGSDTLQRSLMEWRSMIGTEDGRPVQVLWGQFVKRGDVCLKISTDFFGIPRLQLILTPPGGSTALKIIWRFDLVVAAAKVEPCEWRGMC